MSLVSYQYWIHYYYMSLKVPLGYSIWNVSRQLLCVCQKGSLNTVSLLGSTTSYI